MSRVLFIHGIYELGGAEHELFLIVEGLEVCGSFLSVVLSCMRGLHDELRQWQIETTEGLRRGLTSAYEQVMSRRRCSGTGGAS